LKDHEKELLGEYMKSNSKRDIPEIVLRQGKPSAVILDIDQYQQMLEKIEDVEDLEMLKRMRKKPLKFKRLEDFLKEYNPDV
jgi:PHD/YefM family antitoxin component YafN of YafNO toxin-antitoxin module